MVQGLEDIGWIDAVEGGLDGHFLAGVGLTKETGGED